MNVNFTRHSSHSETQAMTDKKRTTVLFTVLCSSPSLTWNVCSKMEYMILPMPKDGSMTLGVISSTDQKHKRVLKI